MIKKNYRLDTLEKEELWRWLGRKRQQIDQPLEELADQVIAETLEIIKPRGILKTSVIEDNGLSGVTLKGNGIKTLLDGSREAALLSVTIGQEIERSIRRYERIDLLKALLMDSAASLAAEKTADLITEDLKKEAEQRGLFITERFSPGYSDFPLSTQPEILRVLDAPRQIGLTVTKSDLLVPRKSVTAVVGLRETPREPRGKRCESCILGGKCLYGICRFE